MQREAVKQWLEIETLFKGVSASISYSIQDASSININKKQPFTKAVGKYPVDFVDALVTNFYSMFFVRRDALRHSQRTET